jgi:hypothetical protein
METYSIIFANGGWAIRQNEGQPEGNYASREAALEVAYAGRLQRHQEGTRDHHHGAAACA